MTLDKLRPLAERFLDPFVTAADRIGLTPDGVSVIAFGFAIVAAGAYAVGGSESPDSAPNRCCTSSARCSSS